MADNPITIVNRALQRIGAASIAAGWTGTDTNTTIMCAIYEPAVRAKLQEHDWNFASIRVSLQAWQCTPVYGFNCAYVLPCDVLQVVETNLDETEPWRIESFYCAHFNGCYTNILVTDTCSPVGIRYTSYVTDPTKWSPLFVDAMVTELAYQAAYPITRNATLLQLLDDERERKWAKAKSRDGQAGRHLKRFLSRAFTRMRPTGGSRWEDPEPQ